MLLWLLALLAGVTAALLQYGRTVVQAKTAPLALLRVLAVSIITALLLGAPAGVGHVPDAEVALDASQSWMRAAPGCDRWTAALDSAARSGRGWLMFGDSVRAGARGEPTDRATASRSLVDRAVGSGRPVVLITDGELDDADALRNLPRGSRTIVMACPAGVDGAVASLEAPRTVLAGDSVTVRVTLAAGGAGSPAGQLELRLDDARLASQDVEALAAFAERVIELRGVAQGGERGAVLRAILTVAGDREPRNDTLTVGVDVSRSAAAVFASTSPDFDAREAVAALRGITSLPTRAFYRVAPGAWRTDGALARIDQDAVAAAVRDAPFVVLHGDTAIFGAPRAVTRGALLLFAPPPTDDGEWFASAVPTSPLAGALTSVAFDSLPPLSVAAMMPRGEWQGLITHRGGSRDDRRIALVGWESPRHVAVLGAAGFWRWRFRGGVRADAYSAFFGSLFDWLASGRSDRRAAVPDATPVRAGAPIRWRRGTTTDSVVSVRVTRRSATGRVYTLGLHFTGGATIAESPPLPPGIYDATMNGGSAVLAVNASRELVPRRPSVRSQHIGGSAAAGEAPSVRSLGWLYLLAIVAVCIEWAMRRRVGLR